MTRTIGMGAGRKIKDIQPFSDHSVNLTYLTNQCYGMNFKIPAKPLGCEIQRVCDSFLSDKRSLVPVSCNPSPTLHYFNTLTKIGIVYTQLLQEGKIFPVNPDQSDWLNGA